MSCSKRHSLRANQWGSFTSRVAVATAQAFEHPHRFVELRIAGREIQAVRGFGGRERVTFLDAEGGEGFLGQDDAAGVADFADFEFVGHSATVVTNVITSRTPALGMWVSKGDARVV
jgi:hypothetical protein